MNLVRLELELRHGRMAGIDALGQSFGEGFGRVAVVQASEWRRDFQRALSDPIDGVAARAIGERERLAALFGRRGGQSWCQQPA